MEMDRRSPSPRTALVVEDDQHLLNMLQDVLEYAGFETTAVDHGSPAMTLLAERRFDVLLVDVNLPDINGLVICDTARERYQDQIAILVIAGRNIERWGVWSFQLGADDFLGKPFDIDELIARIESKLRRVATG
jgi:DNA-binding response OmpR family regulator